MKVAVIGSDGQLGSDVCREFEAAGHEPLPLGHERIEIADLETVRGVLRGLRAGLVINTAAMHHLERCEDHPRGAYAVNAIGALNLATVCHEADVPLMHVSTDYVFDGATARPYLESDLPRPLNVYGNTKLSGEHYVAATTERHVILRVSGLYGHHVCRAKGPNFVDKMLELGRTRPELRVFDDEVLTPTSTREVARQMVRLARAELYGVVHATAAGQCSWYEFAREIIRLAGMRTRVSIADPGEFPVKVPRPKYSVLENGVLRAAGMDVFKPWQEALAEYLGAAVPA